jgi:hypothetical protein
MSSPTGPDFSTVDREAAEALLHSGQLESLHLIPLELGGADIPPNRVYVPVGIGDIKRHIDLDVIRPLVAAGKVSNYAATPEYTGDSFVPVAIVVEATGPESFTHTINIWGDALHRG